MSGEAGSAPVEAEAEETTLSVAAGPLVGPVLRRVVGMLAARARLPLDRLDEAVLVADVVASRAAAYAADTVDVRVATTDRTLWLHIGPLLSGGAKALLGESPMPDMGSLIVKLADEVHVDADGASGGEFLRVRLAYEA